MQYKKLNQMRFVSTNTGNRMYEMATKQFKMACHQTHTFDSGQLSEIFSFSLFILILYLLIPFHFCEGNPTNRIVVCTHVSVINCMFSRDDPLKNQRVSVCYIENNEYSLEQDKFNELAKGYM